MEHSEPKTKLQHIRHFLWPIYGIEHKKFLPMTIMISLILFDYTIMRNTKDVLVTSATGGSEIITFLKVWIVLPLAVVSFFIYSKLSSIYSRQTVFYSTVLFFLGFFALFALVLYPNQALIHPTSSAEWLSQQLPDGFNNIINIYKYWSFSLFYALSELWGSMIATLLFWQFANSIVKVAEAKRFYAHFYLLANLATAFSGIVSKYCAGMGKDITDRTLAYGVTLNYMMGIVVACGLVLLALYYYMDKKVLTDERLVDSGDIKKTKKKLKMSMKESIKFIATSPYLLWVAVLVVSYGISINLVEVAWKNQVHANFSDPSAQQAFWGTFVSYAGISTFVTILVGSSLIRALGWKVGALATPVIIGITGSLFFYTIIFPDSVNPLVSTLGMTALGFAVILGAVQNILSKSTKYALFDPTKEMSYIPLDEESKVKGKAAVDVVGGRLGKAGGALLQQMMFLFIGPVMVIAPYSATIMVVIVIIWIIAVLKLYKLFVAAGGEHAPDTKK
tara:strand:- start:70111 stop:71625 length:1515 start_codon:yes stop_codon:yes gene_type:complete